jgi:DNA-binding XRE family transcriptional regulator
MRHIMQRLLDPEALAELVREWTVVAGGRVKERRTRLGLTQQAVATMADSTPETICRVELGQFTPREGLKMAIAHALATEVAELWPPLPASKVQDRAAEIVIGEAS